MNSKSYSSNSFAKRALAPLAIFFVVFAGLAKEEAPKGKIFAQKLVESTHVSHPETAEIGISARLLHQCETIASTDRGDIGEKCEMEDEKVMRTRNPVVEKEGNGYDVSLPLDDATGRMVAVVGIEFGPKVGRTEQVVLERAEAIAREMKPQIPSAAKLYERVQ